MYAIRNENNLPTDLCGISVLAASVKEETIAIFFTRDEKSVGVKRPFPDTTQQGRKPASRPRRKIDLVIFCKCQMFGVDFLTRGLDLEVHL